MKTSRWTSALHNVGQDDHASHTMRIVAVASGVAALFAATLFLTGCTPLETSADDSPPSTFEHVHELSADSADGSVIVATHDGLFRVTADPDGGATVSGPIGSIDFDPMGFTISDGIAYASGHPGPTTPPSLGESDLGLIMSTNLDQGWANVSLNGEADFHSLAVQTDGELLRVFGFDAGTGLIRTSLDGGATWTAGTPLQARDLLATGDLLYATTPDGLAVSTDLGASFTVDQAAPALYLITGDETNYLAGVDTSGTLWFKTPGDEWSHGHTVGGIPEALALADDRIYVAIDGRIQYSDDVGATWKLIAGDPAP